MLIDQHLEFQIKRDVISMNDDLFNPYAQSYEKEIMSLTYKGYAPIKLTPTVEEPLFLAVFTASVD